MLADQLSNGVDIMNSPIDQLIDTERLISDIKRGKGPEVILDHLLDYPIDVVSLAEVKQMMKADSSVGDIEKKQL